MASFTARYTKIDSGYMGQLIEWPEVVTEGADIEECRSMLRDALREMILAYQRRPFRSSGTNSSTGSRPMRSASRQD
jgi:predicted RNase H-like HicB family nuclease